MTALRWVAFGLFLAGCGGAALCLLVWRTADTNPADALPQGLFAATAGVWVVSLLLFVADVLVALARGQ